MPIPIPNPSSTMDTTPARCCEMASPNNKIPLTRQSLSNPPNTCHLRFKVKEYWGYAYARMCLSKCVFVSMRRRWCVCAYVSSNQGEDMCGLPLCIHAECVCVYAFCVCGMLAVLLANIVVDVVVVVVTQSRAQAALRTHGNICESTPHRPIYVYTLLTSIPGERSPKHVIRNCQLQI